MAVHRLLGDLPSIEPEPAEPTQPARSLRSQLPRNRSLPSSVDFIKIHRTLRTTPAMAAGVTDRLWDVMDLVALWEATETRM